MTRPSFAFAGRIGSGKSTATAPTIQAMVG
jgi:hypothetical protein